MSADDDARRAQLALLPLRQRFVYLARRRFSVAELAEKLGCSARTVYRERERANKAMTAVPGRCACGCGAQLPVTATARRRFATAACRSRSSRQHGRTET